MLLVAVSVHLLPLPRQKRVELEVWTAEACRLTAWELGVQEQGFRRPGFRGALAPRLQVVAPLRALT